MVCRQMKECKKLSGEYMLTGDYVEACGVCCARGCGGVVDEV